MAMTIGCFLSGAIAIAIIVIGIRFLIAPYAAAAGYGLTVPRNQTWSAFLTIKGIRDIASGLFTGLIIFEGSVHLLGWFLLIAAIIPVADALIVIRHGGSKNVALGIHGSTALLMLITSALLLIGPLD
jgi:hypothetical protein